MTKLPEILIMFLSFFLLHKLWKDRVGAKRWPACGGHGPINPREETDHRPASHCPVGHRTRRKAPRVPLPRGNDCLCPTDEWAIATNSPRPRGKSNWCWNRIQASSSQAENKRGSRWNHHTRRQPRSENLHPPPHGPVARLPRSAGFSYPPVSPGQKGSALFPRVPRRYFPPLEGKRNRISGAIGFLRRRRR